MTVATTRLGTAGASLDDNHAAAPTTAPSGPTTSANLLSPSVVHVQIASRYMALSRSLALSLTRPAEHAGSRVPEVEALTESMPSAQPMHLPDSDLLHEPTLNGKHRGLVESPVSLTSNLRPGLIAGMSTRSHHSQSESASSQPTEEAIMRTPNQRQPRSKFGLD